jgi:hypothetical protein
VSATFRVPAPADLGPLTLTCPVAPMPCETCLFDGYDDGSEHLVEACSLAHLGTDGLVVPQVGDVVEHYIDVRDRLVDGRTVGRPRHEARVVARTLVDEALPIVGINYVGGTTLPFVAIGIAGEPLLWDEDGRCTQLDPGPWGAAWVPGNVACRLSAPVSPTESEPT